MGQNRALGGSAKYKIRLITWQNTGTGPGIVTQIDGLQSPRTQSPQMTQGKQTRALPCLCLEATLANHKADPLQNFREQIR